MDAEISPSSLCSFRAVESVPGLTWPSIRVPEQLSIRLGKARSGIYHIGRGRSPAISSLVPDAGVVFSGDLVEYHSTPVIAGDAHFTDWPATLDRIAALDAEALVPGRGAALKTASQVAEGIALTEDFLTTLYGSVSESAGKGRSLKEAYDEARRVMDPKFGRLRHRRALHAVQCLARL